MRSTFPVLRALLLSGAVLAALQACGRRGPPEAPEAATAPPAAGQPAQTSAPRRVSREGHVIPNRPFVLDPLL